MWGRTAGPLAESCWGSPETELLQGFSLLHSPLSRTTPMKVYSEVQNSLWNLPSYSQGHDCFCSAHGSASEKVKDRDEKKDQFSDEEDLEEVVTQDHSDEDWPLLNKDAPRS